MYIYIGQTNDNIIKVGISSRNIRIREKEIQKYYKYNDFKMVKCVDIDTEDNIAKQIEFITRGFIMTLMEGLTLIGDDFIMCDTADQKDIIMDMFECAIYEIVKGYRAVGLVHSITIVPMETIPYVSMFDKIQALKNEYK